MAEQLDLTNPVTALRVSHLVLNYGDVDTALIEIRVTGATNETGATVHAHTYAGQQARDFLKFMNTANFAPPNKSMHKRILEKLVNDGVLAGTVSGTPDP